MNTPTPLIESIATELAESIVILYANFSGREDTNRAQFRKEVYNLIFPKLTLALQEGILKGRSQEAEVCEGCKLQAEQFMESARKEGEAAGRKAAVEYIRKQISNVQGDEVHKQELEEILTEALQAVNE